MVSKVCPDGAGAPSAGLALLLPVPQPGIHHWSNVGSVGFLAQSSLVIFGKLFNDAKDRSKNQEVRITAADAVDLLRIRKLSPYFSISRDRLYWTRFEYSITS